MRKSVCLFILCLGVLIEGKALGYTFFIDLNEVQDDLLEVKLLVPKIDSNRITYIIPKIIPGTYKIYDFGQYIKDFEAFDKRGEKLKVDRLDKNRWEIIEATRLYTIKYWVEDTWDVEGVDRFVFEPAGTNIEEGENIVLNNHGFFGYFEGMKHLPYELNVTRPNDFYGSTGLTSISSTGNVDKITARTYMDLVDSPIMYNKPDTALFKVGDVEILISVYAENNGATAKEFARDIRDILELQKNYLGGKLPIDKYAFIIYLYSGSSISGASGALEHSYSSFYFLPEMVASHLSEIIIDIAAHEFFHIITPLNIHSEEIGDFNYLTPKMSRHLWMYEGMTEYFAGHVQVYEQRQTPIEYLRVLRGKLNGAERFDRDLPFTELSLGCLDKYGDQYSNVYLKGALIGLCLDILLREQSNGAYGAIDMMNSLSKEYGKDRSFKDEELFDKIAELSSPEIRMFFSRFVEGKEELPIKSILEKVGVVYNKELRKKEFTLGGIGLDYNAETERLKIIDVSDMNEFGEKMRYEVGDELISVNGITLEMDKIQEQLSEFKKIIKEGDEIQVVIARKEKGKFRKRKLKGKAVFIENVEKNSLDFNEETTEDQLSLRRAWLGL